MGHKVTASAAGRKCERQPKFTPQKAVATPPECDEREIAPIYLVLQTIKKVGTTKVLAYELRCSPTLVDQMFSGEKPSPFSRTAKLLVILRDKQFKDLACAYVSGLANILGGAFISGEQINALDDIAASCGKKINLNEWSN